MHYTHCFGLKSNLSPIAWTSCVLVQRFASKGAAAGGGFSHFNASMHNTNCGNITPVRGNKSAYGRSEGTRHTMPAATSKIIYEKIASSIAKRRRAGGKAGTGRGAIMRACSRELPGWSFSLALVRISLPFFLAAFRGHLQGEQEEPPLYVITDNVQCIVIICHSYCFITITTF